jgi:uncharacterized protein YqgC (DUF456 family)
MAKKELVVKFLVWWTIITVLIFAALMCVFEPTMPGWLFAFVGVLVAYVMWISDLWRDWLKE